MIDDSVKHLGNAINGAVDAPSDAGVKLYREVFLDPSYLETSPADHIQVNELRQAIDEYVAAISTALDVHAQVCRDVAFHEALKSRKCLSST